MGCERFEELISKYLDKEASPEEEKLLLEHLKSCENCQAVLDDFKKTDNLLCNYLNKLKANKNLAPSVLEKLRSYERKEKKGFKIPFIPHFRLRPAFVYLTFILICIFSLLIFYEGKAKFDIFLFKKLNVAKDKELIVLASKDKAPFKNAKVRFTFKDPKTKEVILNAIAKTDSKGVARLKLTPDLIKEGSYFVDIKVATLLKEGVLTGSPVDLKYTNELITEHKEYRIFLATDKTIYQPGQIMHIKALAMDELNFRPEKEAEIKFELYDSFNNRVYKKDCKTSKFGIASLDFPLADEVNLGNYTLKASLVENKRILAETKKELEVRRYKPPLFEIALALSKDVYKYDDTIEGNISAKYSFGRPLQFADFNLNVKLVEKEGLGTSIFEGKLDKNGKGRFSFNLTQNIRKYFEEGVKERVIYIDAKVKSTEGEIITKQFPITIYKDFEPQLEIIPELVDLIPYEEYKMYVFLRDFTGKPIANATIKLECDNRSVLYAPIKIKTDELGMAIFTFKPNESVASLNFNADISIGDKKFSYNNIRVPEKGGFSYTRNLLIQLDKLVYKKNEGVRLKVINDTKFFNPIGLAEIFKISPKGDKETLIYTNIFPIKGKDNELNLDIPEKLSGLARLAVTIKERNRYRWHRYDDKYMVATTTSKFVYFMPDESKFLDISLKLGKTEYSPREEAQLDILVKDKDGKPVEAALGLVSFDKAVEPLMKTAPDWYEELLTTFSGLKKENYPADILTWNNLTPLLISMNADIENQKELKLTEKRSDYDYYEDYAHYWVVTQEKDTKFYTFLKTSLLILGIIIGVTALICFIRELITFFSTGKVGVIGAFSITLLQLLSIFFLLAMAITLIYTIIYTIRNNYLFPDNYLPAVILFLCAGFVLVILLYLIKRFFITTILPLVRIVRSSGTISALVAGYFTYLVLCIILTIFLGDSQILAPMWVANLIFLLGIFIICLYVGLKSALLEVEIGSGIVSAILLIIITSIVSPTVARARRSVLPERSMSEASISDIVEKSSEYYGYGDWKKEEDSFVVSHPKQSYKIPDLLKSFVMREYFPETLFWAPEVITNKQGRAKVKIPLADSITTWKTSIDAITTDGRFAKKSIDITAFKPLFVNTQLPLKITQDDEIFIPVSVYNYSNKAQTIGLKLEEARWFKLIEDKPVKSVKVASNSTSSVKYHIKVVTPGKHPFIVYAISEDGFTDAIKKVVEVGFKGIEIVNTQNGFIKGDNLNLPLSVSLPPNFLENSQNIQLILSGSQKVQCLSAVNSLLQRPYGCFEQTSSISYVNVLAYKYLLEHNLLAQTDNILKNSPLDIINESYQRMLTFRTPSGGFSWFGGCSFGGCNPNLFLSARAFRIFNEMKSFYPVDEMVLQKLEYWLVSRQTDNGSWAISESSPYSADAYRKPIALTAYILWNLSEFGVLTETKGAIKKAYDYIKEHFDEAETIYESALVSLAFANLPKESEYLEYKKKSISRLMNMLKNVLKEEILETGKVPESAMKGRTLTYSWGNSYMIESIALSVLALYQAGEHLDYINKGIEYLIKARYPESDWGSTQATALALTAILEASPYAELPKGESFNVNVEVNGKPKMNIKIDGSNFNTLQRLDLTPFIKEGTNKVNISLSKAYPLSFQINSRYYVAPEKRESEMKSKGNLNLGVNYIKETDDEFVVRVNITLSQKEQVFMPVAKIGVPPLFTPDEKSLEKLVEDKVITRFSIGSDCVIIYFDKLTNDISFSFKLYRIYRGKVTIPQSIIYEYYTPENYAKVYPDILVAE